MNSSQPSSLRRLRTGFKLPAGVPGVILMAIILVAVSGGAYFTMTQLELSKPSGMYGVAELDLDAAQLGVQVAQLPDILPGPARNFQVQLVYPVKPTPAPMPVLIYFPGWPSDRQDNEGLLRDLASHGYFVASIRYVQEDRRLEGPMDFSTDTLGDKTLSMARSKMSLQAQDATSVLDGLKHLNADDSQDRFKGKLDLDHAGIFGFSFGGAVAAEACAHDPRFRAALNMDGWLFGHGAELSFPQPYFLMSDDDGEPTAAQTSSSDPGTRYPSLLSAHDFRQIRHRLSRPDAFMMTILKTQHDSFSDTPLHYSVIQSATPGPVQARRVSSIIRIYALAFFDRYLKNEPAPLLQSSHSPYQEVRLSLSP